MDLSLSVEEIAKITQPGKILGNTSVRIRRIASLSDAEEGDLSFLANPKYKKEVAGSRASLIFVPADFDGEPREGQTLFFQENTSIALARICDRIERELWPKPAAGIHPSAVIGEGCTISETASVGPLCIVEEGAEVGDGTVLQGQVFVGRGTRIGADCYLAAQVSVQAHCEIGDRVRLHSGAVIGADGYGYDTNREGRHRKLPQVGTVVIGNDVEIGANTTIDRARFEKTEIGEGTKIDNLVQIGHNVIVGRHCLIVAQVGIAGSTRIEDHVVIGGQAGIAGHLRIGRGTMAGGRAGIARDLPPGSKVGGPSALPLMLHQKISILERRLPDLFRDVADLREKVNMLSKQN